MVNFLSTRQNKSWVQVTSNRINRHTVHISRTNHGLMMNVSFSETNTENWDFNIQTKQEQCIETRTRWNRTTVQKDIRFEHTETQGKHATRDEKLTFTQLKEYWKIFNRGKKTKQPDNSNRYFFSTFTKISMYHRVT